MAQLSLTRDLGNEGKDALRAQAVDAAITIIAEHGLATLSIRDLAQAIGKSTTVIVNQFHSKAGLLRAVAEAAMAADEAYHQRFLAEVDGVPIDHFSLRAIATRYIVGRTAPSLSFVRVWEEFVTDPEASAIALPQLAAWAELRATAWSAVLERGAGLARLGPVFFPYLVMEEFYACALGRRLDYELLLQETLNGLLVDDLGGPAPPMTVLNWVVARLAPPEPPGKSFQAGSMPLRLLDFAADLIMEGGIGAVTNRSVTQHVKASTSTILYHFGDMRTFLAQAVWHSVFREIPPYLDGRRPLEQERPADLDAWARLMGQTLKLPPAASPGETGFYVKYARLIAQICVLARRDAAFQDLALLLRGPEGGGTFARREAIWPPQFALTRQSAAHFAIWIKGRALLNSTLQPADATTTEAQLREAAHCLAPRA